MVLEVTLLFTRSSSALVIFNVMVLPLTAQVPRIVPVTPWESVLLMNPWGRNCAMKLPPPLKVIDSFMLPTVPSLGDHGFGCAGWQIGETVQVTLDASQRVTVPGQLITNALPVEVMHITLESGVWLIGGQINFVSFGVPNGAVVWTGGNISSNTPSSCQPGLPRFRPKSLWVVTRSDPWPLFIA